MAAKNKLTGLVIRVSRTAEVKKAPGEYAHATYEMVIQDGNAEPKEYIIFYIRTGGKSESIRMEAADAEAVARAVSSTLEYRDEVKGRIERARDLKGA